MDEDEIALKMESTIMAIDFINRLDELEERIQKISNTLLNIHYNSDLFIKVMRLEQREIKRDQEIANLKQRTDIINGDFIAPEGYNALIFKVKELEKKLDNFKTETMDLVKEATEDYDINKIREYVKTKGYFLVKMVDLEKWYKEFIYIGHPYWEEIEGKYFRDKDELP